MALNSLTKFVAENWQITLKVVAVAISGTLGIVGMLNDFKDKNGRLNRWGKLNLLGLVVASLVGLVIEVAENREQREKDREAQALQSEQLAKAIETNGEVKRVLETSQGVQKGVTATLEEQSKLLGANQRTFREVERGFTPLGSDVMVEYELELPIDDHRFQMLRTILQQDVDKFLQAPPAPSRISDFTQEDGITLHTESFQHKLSSAQFLPEGGAVLGTGGWPSQVMSGPPFRLKVWKKSPTLSDCKIMANPDVAFTAYKPAGGAADAGSGNQDDLGGWARDRASGNRYDFASKKLTQYGMARLGYREGDNGAIQSPLDLEGALVDVMLAVSRGTARMADDPGSSFVFRKLTLYAGHMVIPLDPDHPSKRCGADYYFVLPAHLAAAK